MVDKEVLDQLENLCKNINSDSVSQIEEILTGIPFEFSQKKGYFSKVQMGNLSKEKKYDCLILDGIGKDYFGTYYFSLREGAIATLEKSLKKYTCDIDNRLTDILIRALFYGIVFGGLVYFKNYSNMSKTATIMTIVSSFMGSLFGAYMGNLKHSFDKQTYEVSKTFIDSVLCCSIHHEERYSFDILKNIASHYTSEFLTN